MTSEAYSLQLISGPGLFLYKDSRLVCHLVWNAYPDFGTWVICQFVTW